MLTRNIILFLLLFSLTGCASSSRTGSSHERLIATQTDYESLPGWQFENFVDFQQAFLRSCEKINKRDAKKPFKESIPAAGTVGKWQEKCAILAAMDPLGSTLEPATVRAFMETHFVPYTIQAAGKGHDGLFTGYYEASLHGSRTRSEKYAIPLYKRPPDLITPDTGNNRPDMVGSLSAGRVEGGKLIPYYSRQDIVTGQWPHAAAENVLVWVDDPVDAFFVQVQGSGVVELDDGTEMQIGFAGKNGHPYYAIGKELIKRGYLTTEQVSLQSIRDWLHANPSEAHDVMNTNPSYVFFHEITGPGPIGAQGVALTPLRSLAVDYVQLSYGTPLWLQIPGRQFNRLMVAQDTGGAIRGSVRGDIFWGHGTEAEAQSGTLKHTGRYWALFPR